MGIEQTISGAIIRTGTAPISALATTGTASADTVLNGAGAWVSGASYAPSVAPFFRLRGYVGGVGTGTALDATYFSGGANFPSGKTQRNWTIYASGPGGSFFYDTVGVEHVWWMRMGLTNTTGAAITANVWVPVCDNGTTVRWNSANVLQNPAENTATTFSVAAGQSALYELFFYNAASGDGVYDTSNQGVFEAFCDALDQPGMSFYDPGI